MTSGCRLSIPEVESRQLQSEQSKLGGRARALLFKFVQQLFADVGYKAPLGQSQYFLLVKAGDFALGFYIDYAPGVDEVGIHELSEKFGSALLSKGKEERWSTMSFEVLIVGEQETPIEIKNLGMTEFALSQIAPDVALGNVWISRSAIRLFRAWGYTTISNSWSTLLQKAYVEISFRADYHGPSNRGRLQNARLELTGLKNMSLFSLTYVGSLNEPYYRVAK